MEVYRLSSCQYSEDLSGQGARIYGGRWNSIGVPVVYFANSRALAVLEVLVHLPPNLLPENFCMTQFIWNKPFVEINENELPKDWNVFPFPKQLQVFIDKYFKENRTALLKVPSAIVEGEFNFILNPNHPDSKGMIKKTSNTFSFDKRMF